MRNGSLLGSATVPSLKGQRAIECCQGSLIYGQAGVSGVMPTCSMCLRELERAEFSSRPNGRPTSYCKPCQRLSSKANYSVSKTKHNAQRVVRRNSERQGIRAYLREVKNQPCLDCKELHPYWAMDFDHRDRSTKSFTLAHAVRMSSLKRVKAEIAKCDLVCALCHRYRTFGVRRGVG